MIHCLRILLCELFVSNTRDWTEFVPHPLDGKPTEWTSPMTEHNSIDL